MKYKVTAVITFEIETGDAPKQVAIEKLNLLLPQDFEFSLSSITGIKPAPKVVIGQFAIDDVLPFATREYTRKDYVVEGQTYQVRMNSTRYWVFKNSLKCASCGLEGKKFLLEYSGPKGVDRSPHFNLYAEEDGQDILMTKDHILAASRGGSSDLESGNYQTMCSVCNMLKAAYALNIQQVAELRTLYRQRRRGMSLKSFNKLLADTRDRMLAENLEESKAN